MNELVVSMRSLCGGSVGPLLAHCAEAIEDSAAMDGALQPALQPAGRWGRSCIHM